MKSQHQSSPEVYSNGPHFYTNPNCAQLDHLEQGFSGLPWQTSPPSTAGAGSIPGQGAEIPPTSQPKKSKPRNGSNIVTSSIKTLKMAHIKKIFERASAFSRDILNEIILYSEDCPGHFQTLNSISGIYLLDTRSNTS